MDFSWAYLTDNGLKRTSNEDSALGLVLNLDTYQERNTLGLFVVSDGMGGKEKGELASKIAIKTIGEAFVGTFLKHSLGKVAEVANYGEGASQTGQEILASPANFLVQSIQEANRRIFHLKRGGNRLHIGATVTAGILSEELLTLGHVGDCRCYLFYEQNMRLLTRDHSMVNELIRKGILTQEEGRNHPQRNILARALGSNEEVEVDTTVSVLGRGCKILMCTDGLYTMVPDTRIQEILSRGDHPQVLIDQLVAAANEAGGRDNVTALLIQII
jgi:serine/threonine protein phosphatase PrpC